MPIFCIGIAKVSCNTSLVGKLSPPHKAYAILIGDMKGGNNPFGYTIVEVLIVMAVSGFMFVIAASFISGKQERTSFQVASNEMVSRIQEVIDQVSNGEYTDIPLSCTVSGSAVKYSGAASDLQGQNQECVFLGKIIHFAEDDKNKYEVFSLGGAREVSAGVPAVTLAQTHVTAIDDNGPPPVDLTSHHTTSQNVEVTDVKEIALGGGMANSFAIGFVQGLGTATTTAGSTTYNSGSQTVSMYYISGVGNNLGHNPTRAHINNGNNGSRFVQAKSACIAIYDGRRGALINIGSDNNQLTVSAKQLGVTASPTCP